MKTPHWLLILALLAGLLLPLTAPAPATLATPLMDYSAPSTFTTVQQAERSVRDYGALPLYFVENSGQRVRN